MELNLLLLLFFSYHLLHHPAFATTTTTTAPCMDDLTCTPNSYEYYNLTSRAQELAPRGQIWSPGPKPPQNFDPRSNLNPGGQI